MEILAKQTNKRFIVGAPNKPEGSGYLVDLDNGTAEYFDNIQVPIKFGYWFDPDNIPQETIDRVLELVAKTTKVKLKIKPKS